MVRLRLEGKLVTTREADGTTFGRVGQSVCLSVCVSVCVSVCAVRALTFESFDLETSFLQRCHCRAMQALY